MHVEAWNLQSLFHLFTEAGSLNQMYSLPSLACRFALGTTYFHLPRLELQVDHPAQPIWVLENLNSSPQTCLASIWTTKPSTQLLYLGFSCLYVLCVHLVFSHLSQGCVYTHKQMSVKLYCWCTADICKQRWMRDGFALIDSLLLSFIHFIDSWNSLYSRNMYTENVWGRNNCTAVAPFKSSSVISCFSHLRT